MPTLRDLKAPLPFGSASFDFLKCNAVIQHIEPDLVRRAVLPELARVLCPQGVLQLMFKNGEGVLSMFDEDYGFERAFQLYGEKEVLSVSGWEGMGLIEAESPDRLGGLMYFTDGKGVDHCLFFARKGA